MLQVRRQLLLLGSLLLLVVFARSAAAQDVDLAAGGADNRWRGLTPQSAAGFVLDHGTMNGDSRRDLIIGAPGAIGSGHAGQVYILFGGMAQLPGERPLSAASVTLTGAAADDLFGRAVAAGNILNNEGTNPRNLVVAAPNAESGRGRVYVFGAGFADGTSIGAADAVVTVIGAAGDRLGTALATADLDNDGYRELIMGAPGNNRVYVIYGGPTLAGQARDMSLTSSLGPDVTITGAGIGSVLTAGAVTADSVYDLFIGAPSLNLTYMIQGPGARTLNAQMLVSRDETAYFSGVGSDRAGTSLRLGDLDGDGRTDLFIGAPNAAPSDSGATYVLFGRAASEPPLTSRSLAQADVIIRGPGAAAGAGAMLASGDVNRDYPNDIVIGAPGAATSAGAVYVYYGRLRQHIGALQPDGTRVVQLGGDTPEYNLRILGDPAGGPVNSIFVYEVTGEGARDIIVGAPSADTDGGVDSGRVYFAISPKITIVTSPAYATAVQGGSGRGALSVVNPSQTRITYVAESQTPWLTTFPVDGSTVLSAPGSLNLLASAASLAPGDYIGNATVKSTSEHLEMTFGVKLNLTVISAPQVSANVTFPAMAGTPITWTANSTGGAAGVLFQFWRRQVATGTWSMVQDWSTSNTYTWTPTPQQAGDYSLQVWVKTPQSQATYDAYVATSTFTVEKSVPKITSFSNTGVYPVAPNTPIQVSATATGGSAALEYKFWVFKQGAGWTVLKDYGPETTTTWTPATPGSYALQVWVRSQGITDSYEAWQGTDFLSVSSTDPLTVRSFTIDPALPAKAGRTLTFTAVASGGTNGPLQYKFWRHTEGAGWSMVRDWSDGSSWSWTPTAAGRYAVQVWVRSNGSTANYEAWQTTGFFDVTVDPLSPAALSADVVFPVPSGTPVKWTATVSGGIAPHEYQFWVFRQGVGWSIGQAYSTSRTFTWTPPADGTYAVQVWVKNSGSSASYDTWTSSGYFTIASSGPAAIASFTADQTLPVTTGTTVTWTARGTGGTAGPLQYKFWRYSQATGTWTVVKDYSSDNTFAWTVGSGDNGVFALQAWIRSAGSSANYEGWASTGYFTVK